VGLFCRPPAAAVRRPWYHRRFITPRSFPVRRGHGPRRRFTYHPVAAAAVRRPWYHRRFITPRSFPVRRGHGPRRRFTYRPVVAVGSLLDRRRFQFGVRPEATFLVVRVIRPLPVIRCHPCRRPRLNRRAMMANGCGRPCTAGSGSLATVVANLSRPTCRASRSTRTRRWQHRTSNLRMALV